MKRFIAGLLIIMALIFAADVRADDSVYETLISASVTDTAGAEVAMLNTASRYACTATWGGTAPTSITFWVQLTDETGVYDDTNGDAVVTMTASPWRFYIINRAGQFIRGKRISKVGGDATTSLTLKCKALR